MIRLTDANPNVPTSWDQKWFLGLWRDILAPTVDSLLPIIVAPRTYVLDGAAAAGGTGSSSAPFKSLRQAAKYLRPGDTLVIKDGTYTGTDNDLTAATLPVGQPDGWITLQAENRGGVVFTSSCDIFNVGVPPTAYYLVLDGFIFNKAEMKRFSVKKVIVKNCGFRGGPSTGNYHTMTVGANYDGRVWGAEDVLFQDCWFWGPGGRYKLIAYNAKNVIFRRCVARWDQGWNDSSYESSDVMVYDCRGVRVQNCISIDSLRPASSGTANWIASFRCNYNYLGGDDIKFQGCIGVNNQGGLFEANGLNASTIGSPSGTFARNPRVTNLIVEHMAGAKIGSTDQKDAISIYKALDAIVCNSTVADLNQNGRAFLVDSITRNTRGSRVEDCVAALDGTGTGFLGGIQNNCLTYSSLAAAATAGLTYLPQPDASSTIATAYAGASILYRIGNDDTMFGEPGMEAYGDGTTDGNSLWPFPNEDLIKTCMSAAGGFGDSDRGWTAGSLTLTEYIWGQLGTAGPP